MDLEKKMAQQIKKYHLVLPGEKLVAAISGGPDSVAMLYALLQVTADWPVMIHVAHLNHLLRGQAAAAEADFVAGLAQSWGLPCTVEAIDVTAWRREKGCSLEEAARQVRYNFLRRVAWEVEAAGILTAHHADDQAETLLLHLIRGAGMEGLAAISPREGDLRRPFLEVSKKEILAYCQENRLPYCLDASNLQTDFLRNRIRLQLMPALKDYNPRIVAALNKTAEICRGENELLDCLSSEAMEKLALSDDTQNLSFDFSSLLALPIALQRRVLRRLYDRMANTHGGLDFDQTERLLTLATGKELALPGGVRACRDYQRLSFRCMDPERKGPKTAAQTMVPVQLSVPGRTEIKSLAIAVSIAIKPVCQVDKSAAAIQGLFSPAMISMPLFIRTRRPGDYFQPAGLIGRKKLQDFFIDEKISRSQRDQVPLLIAGENIVWVVGRRFATHLLPPENEAEMVVVTVEKLSPE